MTGRRRQRDSISRRFAAAIAASAAMSLALNVAVDAILGGPVFSPPLRENFLAQLPGIVETIQRAPSDQRTLLAQAATTRSFQIDWYPSPPAQIAAMSPVTLRLPGDSGRADGSFAPGVMMVALRDGSWLGFSPPSDGWSFQQPLQWVLRCAILLSSIAVVSLLGASRLARPIDAFAAAARRFGADASALPMAVQGPAELQQAIAAFNTMQSQIQRFVAGQAAMFAAISHDLRTPLTRMRLRGEFIEDRDQQARLFRDIAEMQTMIESVLTFMRDNAADEATTSLDLAELLRSIADDYADLGTEITYTGPLHLAFPGRPIGLRRAFGNLVDNAVKYGVRPAIDLQVRGTDVRVTITDHGPGIPAEALDQVFLPFQRLEPSRNRHTGGMGLGLTSARAGVRAHGGDITLRNAESGGLRATVILPLSAANDGYPQRIATGRLRTLTRIAARGGANPLVEQAAKPGGVIPGP